ncbi:glycosyltransferase [bacterium SCSIO 12741]|nr:glycosyltransferase [bacterium SCSIO 12741]
MKRVLHVIDTLERGGAETLLATFLSHQDPKFNQILILSGENDFEEELSHFVIHNLRCENRTDLLKAPRKIGHAARAMEADIIHAHLFLSGLLCSQVRLGSMKLVCHLHNRISKSVFQEKPMYRHLEKLLYRRRHSQVFVSQSIREDYQALVGKPRRAEIITNCVSEEYFQTDRTVKPMGKNWVTVGSLKAQKNTLELVRRFKDLAPEGYQLTVVGGGPQESELKTLIREEKIENVELLGRQPVTPSFWKPYDVFVSLSQYEGFGIAAAEAFCSGLNLYLADIPTYREIFGEVATFLSLDNPSSLSEGIKHPVQMPEPEKAQALYERLSPGYFRSQIKTLYETLD